MHVCIDEKCASEITSVKEELKKELIQTEQCHQESVYNCYIVVIDLP